MAIGTGPVNKTLLYGVQFPTGQLNEETKPWVLFFFFFKPPRLLFSSAAKSNDITRAHKGGGKLEMSLLWSSTSEMAFRLSPLCFSLSSRPRRDNNEMF